MKIKLGNSVIVSDPSYNTETWCQAKIENVKEGEYDVICKKVDTGDWGVRNSTLSAIHSSYRDTLIPWEVCPAEIGVDSGQAGIFDISDYRKDGMDIEVPTVAYDGESFEKFDRMLPIEAEGDDWYRKICKLTLGKEGWGYYSTGVVARSGYGDGGYVLYVAKNEEGQIIGFSIDFLVEEIDTEEICK